MTRRSIAEYAEALRERYLRASRVMKGGMLDEFTTVTGLHRKSAIRLLHRAKPPGLKRCGRPAAYREITPQLKAIWEASDHICSKRLHPFLPEMVRILRRTGSYKVDALTTDRLCSLSPSTIDRLLKPYRKGGQRGFTTTRPGSLLKSAIPIRTFADWEENKPGFMETDLVAHCGESVEGFYLNTLCAVDVFSGWTECLPVWGKGQLRVRQAVHHLRARLPFPLLGLDSDNGSEFINQCFYNYCRDEKITFTRSRSYKKNDSCHVEQKNGQVVRRLIGYDRYSNRASFDSLGRVYDLIRLYVNFFQPTMKLIAKSRHGAKVHKVYDRAQTPYRRLLETDALAGAKKAELAAIYQGLDPAKLLAQINGNLEYLWQGAKHPVNSSNLNYESTRRASVTV